MHFKKVILTRSSNRRATFWQTLRQRAGTSKGIAGLLVVAVVVGLLPMLTVAAPKIAQADMLSVLRRAFNGYTTSQNPVTAANTPTPNSAGGTTTPTCPTGQIILGMDTTTTPPKPKCGPPSSLTNPPNHNWTCPAGQVEGARSSPDGPPSCVPCPSGTVRMYVFGSESCQRPDFTPNYNSIPPGYQIGANGQICLADGQSYAGAHNPRYKSTAPGFGACCNGGLIDPNPVVAGSSVHLFICGAKSSSSGGSSGGVTPGNTATNLPGWEKKPDGTVCRSDGQSYAGAHNPRYKSTAPGLGECCNGGYIDPNPVVAGSSVHLFICGPNTGSRSSSGGTTSSIGVRVVGALESATCTTVSGWAYDAASVGRVVTVDFYADGLIGTGRKIGSVTPRVQRNDINTQHRITGTHGFSWAIPAGTFAAGSTHRVYAYAVEGNNQLLPGSPLTFTCAAAANNSQNTTTPTFQGGPPDANSTFVISAPPDGSTVIGRSVSVSYYSTAELLPTDYAVLQLDSQTPVGINYSTGGTYQFNNVPPGTHTIRGYVAREDGTKIPNTSTSNTFTVE
ncbi:MAG: hypothetical protein JNK33_00505 [Candidatus Doudnabacteria bacterium]|nr:hypothetical protein [Candidatus Doudnabacteria bacterium]